MVSLHFGSNRDESFDHSARHRRLGAVQNSGPVRTIFRRFLFRIVLNNGQCEVWDEPALCRDLGRTPLLVRLAADSKPGKICAPPALSAHSGHNRFSLPNRSAAIRSLLCPYRSFLTFTECYDAST